MFDQRLHVNDYMKEFLAQEDVYTLEAWNVVSGAVMDALDPPNLLINGTFIQRMETELQNNAHQGDWNKWTPTPGQGVDEILHHLEKLKAALVGANPDQVSEYTADIANIAMRISDTHGVTKPHQ
ncbi:MAG: hypothetical protein JXR12_01535 [Neptunomonas phycophila]|uniref:hypothetical protein n=1 Tax=Neptunomonas phycophila TaxID=1572645 RepID=UPI003B8DA3F6